MESKKKVKLKHSSSIYLSLSIFPQHQRNVTKIHELQTRMVRLIKGNIFLNTWNSHRDSHEEILLTCHKVQMSTISREKKHLAKLLT